MMRSLLSGVGAVPGHVKKPCLVLVAGISICPRTATVHEMVIRKPGRSNPRSVINVLKQRHCTAAGDGSVEKDYAARKAGMYMILCGLLQSWETRDPTCVQQGCQNLMPQHCSGVELERELPENRDLEQAATTCN